MSLGRISWYLKSFCVEVTVSRRKDLRLPILVCGHLCLIQLDCRVLWSSMRLEGINWYHIFCMEMTISGRKDLILPLLVVCNQFYLLFNQIAGFFDHHYLWMGSINTLEYLHWGNHQQKEGFETSSFVWVWPVAFLVQ